MILSELYQKIYENTGYSSSQEEEKSKILNIINNSLRDFYNIFNLNSTILDGSFKTIPGIDTYYLTVSANKIISINISNGAELECVNRHLFYKKHTISSSGQPSIYVPLGRSYVANQPTNEDYVNLVSTNATDTQTVVIKGMSNNAIITESLTLDGTNTVQSQNKYSYILSISKTTTNGIITATCDNKTILTLNPDETSREYIKIKLYPTPNDEYTIQYLYYPKSLTVRLDNDIIPLPDKYLNAFEIDVISKIFLQQGSNLSKSWLELSEFKKNKLQEMDYQSEEETPDFNFEEFM